MPINLDSGTAIQGLCELSCEIQVGSIIKNGVFKYYVPGTSGPVIGGRVFFNTEEMMMDVDGGKGIFQVYTSMFFLLGSTTKYPLQATVVMGE
jgi:hypothetical protein